MKSIKKITNKVTDNFSALAGSALLVGATLTGAAGMAAAQSGSSGNSMDMNLGDYPQPFVTEDGQVETSIVLGSDAAVTDVVGATEIAGSLGAAAFGEETVSAEGGNFGWTASNGVTLDTRNDQLYFGDQLDTVRETLTEDDLNILSETTFTDDSNEETDITNYLNLGDQEVVFGNGADELDNEDPALHVEVPSESSVNQDSYLFNLQANFEDSIDFASEDVAGEEIELFGTEYTVAQDNEDNNDETLLLYGSQQEVDVSTGESTTITVNEEEVTLEVVSVNSGSNAAVRVDGTLESVASGDTISVNNEEVRIDEIIKTGGSDSSQGVVNFQIGSQELTLVDGEPIQDSNDDDIEGSYVEFDGGETTNIGGISSIDLYVGAEDDDEDALTAGDTFSHSALPGVEVHFGGLNPDASEEGDTVSEVAFSTSGDDTTTLDFTAQGGDDASINYAYSDDPADLESNPVNLADSDNDAIQTVEGAAIEEDEYFLSDAGDFSHMWEVTGIDRDNTGTSDSDFESGDEATVDLRDVVTGDTVEVELQIEEDRGGDNDVTDGDSGSYEYEGTEVIDGQTYHFELDADTTSPALNVAWGDSSGTGTAGADDINTGDHTSVSPALDTETGASTAFFKEVTEVISGGYSVSDVTEFQSTDQGQSISEGNNNGDAYIDLDLSEIAGTESQDVALQIEGTTDNSGGTYSDNTITYDDSENSASFGSSPTNVDVSVPSEDVLRITLTANSGASVDSAQVTQAGEEGTITAVDADGTEVATGDFTELDVTYGGESPTLDLTSYEHPSTESTDAQYGPSFTYDPSSAGELASYTVSGVQYEIDGAGDLRSAGLDVSGDNPNAVASALILPEDDNDQEAAYVFEHGYDSGDEELTSKNLAQSPSSLEQASLESDDDVSAGYDFYGTYHEVDDDGQGSVTLQVPDGQSVAGAAVTGADGSLSMGGGSGSATAASPTYSFADGLLTDDGSVGQAQSNDNLVLVGGPAANSLTQELVDENQTMPAGDYTQGQGMIQMVDGFSEGNSALVVAGATGEDTRTAAEFLADYRNNADSLEGNSQVTIETSSRSVVN